MQSSLYVGLSGQLTYSRRLDAVANNLANASTSGFRAEEINFATLIGRKSVEPTSFPSVGVTHLSTTTGDVTKTGNPFDVAIRGNAWMAVQTQGGIAYTRDGRLEMAPDGQLRNVSGAPVLDVGGAPIQLDPSADTPAIAADGMITQNGRQIGAIGLFTIDPGARLKRADVTSVVPDQEPQPALDFRTVSVAQGFLERSNVNPTTELSRMITISRTFEALSSSLSDAEQALRSAVRTLGSSNG